jgi:hypothetical protein
MKTEDDDHPSTEEKKKEHKNHNNRDVVRRRVNETREQKKCSCDHSEDQGDDLFYQS